METTASPPERRVSRRLALEARIFRVYVDEVEGPAGRATRVVVDHPGAVAVLPLLDDGRAVLIRQFRYAIGRYLVEVPAGMLEAGEDPEAAARRELAEETGFRARRLRRLAAVYPTPGFCNERLVLFVADGLQPGRRSPEADEHLEPLVVTREEAGALVASGAIVDAKTLLALLWWLRGAEGGDGACAWW